MQVDSFYTALILALNMIFSQSSDIWQIVFLSISVSFKATIIAIFISFGIVLFIVNLSNLWLKNFLVSILHALISIPSVVVGLLFYILLANNGVFGNLKWLFTQKAMILGQIMLALPLLATTFYVALKNIYKDIWQNVLTLGGSKIKFYFCLIFDCRYAIISGIILAFSRVISEVGAAMMLGGNILGQTRTITTAISLQTSQGEFIQGIALGIILLIMALFFSLSIFFISRKVV